jgi:predicted Zn-dependent protease
LLYLLLLAGFTASSIGCSIGRSPVTGQRRAYGYSWAQERKIGQEADEQITAAYGLYDEEELASYVETIGQRVLEHSDMRGPDVAEQFRETPFTFRVLDSPILNAFALPGGYIYVTRGILAHMQNEAQLAVVLGHEIAHVAARHASQRKFEQSLGQVGLLGGAILGQEMLGLPAEQILDLGSAATQLLFLRYSRGDERESDDLGVEYAAKAGYEVSQAAGFFSVLKRMSDQQEGGLPTWMSSHPDPGNRAETMFELADRWNDRLDTDMTTVGQDPFFQRIEGIVLGEDPRQGFTREGSFYHPELAFQFEVPSNWAVANQPSQVQLIDPDQQAAIIFQIAREAGSPRAAAMQLTQQQGVVTVSEEARQINDLPAHEVVARLTQQGQVYRLVITAIELDDTIYRFIGYSGEAVFPNYRELFRSSAQSFDRLTDSELLNTQPRRLQITVVEQANTLRELLGKELPSNVTLEALAIMNQRELDETIGAGERIKTVR